MLAASDESFHVASSPTLPNSPVARKTVSRVPFGSSSAQAPHISGFTSGRSGHELTNRTLVTDQSAICACGHHGRLAHNVYGCEGLQLDGPCACQRSANDFPAIVISRGYKKVRL